VQSPLLGVIFALLRFSRSGIPPLGGFFVKLDVLAALLESSHVFPTYVLLLRTVASFFYYLRVCKILFFDAVPVRDALDPVATSTISFVAFYGSRDPLRLWVRAVLFILLLGYLFLVQGPLLHLFPALLRSLVLIRGCCLGL